MITREAWDKMTPQQQFDYARLLEDTVDDFAEADARITDMAHQVLLNMHADSDLLHGMVVVPDGATYVTDDIHAAEIMWRKSAPGMVEVADATSPHYRRQFMPSDEAHS